ncbi:hypothetical protein WN51_05752 [Melipona quadrifasciata]|uniref:Uncharacterized protein n=1 Tax=Melipona quadrifasciata TaxID=166423 RepID=A0A0M9A770_9HYME|nr:hypothetical protein WN51_05752 [Melipona quadrifasciata]
MCWHNYGTNYTREKYNKAFYLIQDFRIAFRDSCLCRLCTFMQSLLQSQQISYKQ